MSQPKLAVIYNIKSGSSLSLNDLKQLFKSNNLEATYLKLTPRLSNDIKKAHKNGVTTFVAVGGDGTINAVASEVIKYDVRLAVLPLGTLNHFAKDLGIPLDPEEAVKVIANGKPKRVDTAWVNDVLFLNNSSIGLYPLLVQEREKKEGKISKIPATIYAFFRTLRKQASFTATIQLDDQKKKKFTTPFIFIGNNSYNLNTPGAISRPSLTTGNISVAIVKTANLLRMLRIAVDVAIGRPDLSGYFVIYKAKAVTVSLPEDHPEIAFDGEVKAMPSPLTYTIKPKSLQVIVPR